MSTIAAAEKPGIVENNLSDSPLHLRARESLKQAQHNKPSARAIRPSLLIPNDALNNSMERSGLQGVPVVSSNRRRSILGGLSTPADRERVEARAIRHVSDNIMTHQQQEFAM